MPSSSVLWPCVDVGGTSIRVVLVADRGDTPPEPVVRLTVPTPRGLPALVSTIRQALQEASSRAGERGQTVAEVLAVGTPGRLQAVVGGRRTIAPRSATNLEAFPGELDGADLAGELADGLGLLPDRVFWDNDAVLQGRYLIGELIGDPSSAGRMAGHVVACINPGTGLGGCVAEVSDDHTIEVFTDGHVSELLVHPADLEADLGPLAARIRSVSDASEIVVEVWRGRQTEQLRLRSPDRKQAEDFIAGTGLESIAAGLERCSLRLDPPVSCFGRSVDGIDGAALSALLQEGDDSSAARAARFIGDLGGLALSRLLQALHDGTARKGPTFPNWPVSDLDRVRGVSRFIFGGGITGTALGRHLISGARARLDWPELELFEMERVAGDAGALGAFSLIPEVLRRTAGASP
jgi:hypothetical protein